MTTLVAKVKGVQVYVSEDSASVTLTLDKEYEGYKQDATGSFVKTMTNKVSFYRSALTAQLCDANDDIAMYRACQEKALSQHQLGMILFNATLTLNLEEHAAGEVIERNGEEITLERDCIFVSVAKVKLSERAITKLDAALTL